MAKKKQPRITISFPKEDQPLHDQILEITGHNRVGASIFLRDAAREYIQKLKSHNQSTHQTP